MPAFCTTSGKSSGPIACLLHSYGKGAPVQRQRLIDPANPAGAMARAAGHDHIDGR
jgi:hypothetical protein